MVVSKNKNIPTCNNYIDNEKIEQIQEFEYLGSMITSDVRCDKEIKPRIAIAKKKFMEKKSVFTNSKISIETRKRFLKCYIWSVLLYGSESWTISAEMKKKLEAMEMWCCLFVCLLYFILSRLLYLALSANLGLLCMPHPGMGPLV